MSFYILNDVLLISAKNPFKPHRVVCVCVKINRSLFLGRLHRLDWFGVRSHSDKRHGRRCEFCILNDSHRWSIFQHEFWLEGRRRWKRRGVVGILDFKLDQPLSPSLLILLSNFYLSLPCSSFVPLTTSSFSVNFNVLYWRDCLHTILIKIEKKGELIIILI